MKSISIFAALILFLAMGHSQKAQAQVQTISFYVDSDSAEYVRRAVLPKIAIHGHYRPKLKFLSDRQLTDPSDEPSVYVTTSSDALNKLSEAGGLEQFSWLQSCNPDGPYQGIDGKIGAVQINPATENAPLPRDNVPGFADPLWKGLMIAFRENSGLEQKMMQQVLGDIICGKPALSANFQDLIFSRKPEAGDVSVDAKTGIKAQVVTKDGFYAEVAVTIYNQTSEALRKVRIFGTEAPPAAFLNRDGTRKIISAINEIGPFAAYDVDRIEPGETQKILLRVDLSQAGTFALGITGVRSMMLDNADDGWGDGCYKESEVPDPIDDPFPSSSSPSGPGGGTETLSCVDSGCGNIGCENAECKATGEGESQDCTCHTL